MDDGEGKCKMYQVKWQMGREDTRNGCLEQQR
jgi:hypothetical protein